MLCLPQSFTIIWVRRVKRTQSEQSVCLSQNQNIVCFNLFMTNMMVITLGTYTSYFEAQLENDGQTAFKCWIEEAWKRWKWMMAMIMVIKVWATYFIIGMFCSLFIRYTHSFDYACTSFQIIIISLSFISLSLCLLLSSLCNFKEKSQNNDQLCLCSVLSSIDHFYEWLHVYVSK